MTLEWLITWWNLIFVIPFVMGLMYMGLYITTGITFGEGDLDADADADLEADADVDTDLDADVEADLDADVEADIEAEADLDADVDADAEVETDAEVDGEHHYDKSVHVHADNIGLSTGLLGLLGVGRVPFSVVLMTLLVLWGLIGLITNSFLWPTIDSPWLMLLIAVPVAALGSVAGTGAFARLMGRFMPLDESTARPKRYLVGLVGEALYTIDERFGMVVVKNASGDRYQVPCRVGPGSPPIGKGRAVLLVDYEADEDIFRVRNYELAEPKESAPAGEGEAEPAAAPARPAQREHPTGS